MGRQASITSFFSGKGIQKVEDAVNEPEVVVCDLTQEEEKVVQVKTVSLPKAAKEELRARWQRKVLGEKDSMKKSRSKTQEDVVREGDVKKFTPLEKQVVELHRQYHPGCVLAIECGYKYKFFGVDAEIASKVLGIFSYPDRNFLNASVPTARIQHHVRRLVSAGYEVGIVSQTETAAIKASDAKTRSQPFKRELTQRFTPATIEAIQPDSMCIADTRVTSNERNSSYVVCVMEGEEIGGKKNCMSIGMVAVECSTGSILQARFDDCAMRMQLESNLQIARPSDLLLMDSNLSPGTQRMLETYCQGRHVRVRTFDSAKYALSGASTAIKNHLGGTSVDAILQLDYLVLQALSHTLDYLDTFGLSKLIQSETQIRQFSDIEEIYVSSNALQQLEILRNSDDGSEYGSLIWLLDQTKTAFGGRMIRTWVTSPLKNPSSITHRLDAVEEILHSIDKPHGTFSMERVISCLNSFDTDLERSLGRIIHGTILPSELWSFMDAFKDIGLKMGIEKNDTAALDSISSPLVRELVSSSINYDAALYAQDIAASLHKDACLKNDMVMVFQDANKYIHVAEKKAIVAQHEKSLEDLKPALAKSLGVASVEYVKIQNQGEYLIEVPVNMEKRVPSCWVRVSSTKKMLRFLPPEVKKEIEALELAREYLVLTAKSSWNVLLKEISEHFADFKSSIQALASLDCLISFASISSRQGYVKPEIVSSPSPLYKVQSGRHPIIEVIHEQQPFVPNSITIGSDKEVCMVITGPNMGGKSVYIKQAAIIAYMAQIGCFVPAASCILRPFDAIFTRMGAADSIALGRSTFLEELAEASQILEKATSSSLVIVDELGRGTSSSDGYAVAAATMKYLSRDIGCVSLFVTHYPEIAVESSSSQLPEASPYYMGYILDKSRAEQPRVTFTYTLEKGVAHSSYGLNVASMAGVPESAVQRASQISANIQSQLMTATMEACFQKAATSFLSTPNLSSEKVTQLQEFVSSMIHLTETMP